MPVPLLDLTRQYADIGPELEEAALRVLRSCRYILGPEVTAFEEELAAYLGTGHVIGLSSGTDALLAPLMALDIGPGDAVALPDYTFFATAGVVHRLNAKPVFVDVEPRYLTMDPAGLEAALECHPNIKAVITVHLYGAASDTTALRGLLEPHGIPLIEDAAQAIGTRLEDGSMAGTAGVCGTFSAFPSKNLGALGDAGFLSTEDEAFARQVAALRNHGQSDTYRHETVGGNFRIDALQAALLRVKLRRIDEYNAKRRANAARYRQMFDAAGLTDRIVVPEDQPHHTYHQYVIHFRDVDRDAARATLTERGIGCAVYYPIPLHNQPCFRDLGYGDDSFPVSVRASRTGLGLPIFPELTDDEAQQVVDGIAAVSR